MRMENNKTSISLSTAQLNPVDLAASGYNLFQAGKPAQAQRMYMQAILLDPQNKSYKDNFVQCLSYTRYQAFNPGACEAILICLNDPEINYRKISNGWLDQVLFNPDLAPLINLLDCGDYEELKQTINHGSVINSLNNMFFIQGLKKCLLMHFKFEPLITYLRHYYLLEASVQQKQEAIPFLCALATKCFNNEYIYNVTEEEEKYIEVFKLDKNITIPETVLLGCYYPLYQLPHALDYGGLAIMPHNDDVIDLMRLQIYEPLDEKQLQKEIISFAPIKNSVSDKVQKQYEEHPYPRWISCVTPNLTEAQRQQSKGKDVLIAGCGTGQEAALTSAEMPYASIDAIDLSRVSLGYAIRKARVRNINNVRFLHGDILDSAKLDKLYDFIFSSGVLHHMEDPKTGLKILCDILKPQGVISISLYSDIGRQDIALCQQWVKDQGYGSTTAAIRKFRQDIFALEETDPIKKIAYLSDFYSASECRDLVFHVQEHRFSCLSIKEMIEDLGLVLLHFGVRDFRAKTKYRQLYPDDPKMINLENWHQFEIENPRAFVLMYDLVLGRQEEYDLGTQPDWLRKLAIFR